MSTQSEHPGDTRAKLLDAAFAEIYSNGYHGTATAAILKRAGVPKGSMYHFFDSKKALALAVIEERIFPRMDAFFDFESDPGETLFESLERIFAKMATHELLIANGCPMHRLMVEMAPLDSGFETLLTRQYARFVSRLASLFQRGVDRHELRPLNTEAMARFFITSTWGELSLPPSLSSKHRFETHTRLLLKTLDLYRKSL
jgi:TetR/AcrR family transcriptional repressor of nem operon